MQNSYHDIEHWTSVNLMPHILPGTPMNIGPTGVEAQTDQWIVTGVQVKDSFRGQGHAGRLLERVIADADAEGVLLMLMVATDGTGLSVDQLISFYGRRGFVMEDEDLLIMNRPPQFERSAVHA